MLAFSRCKETRLILQKTDSQHCCDEVRWVLTGNEITCVRSRAMSFACAIQVIDVESDMTSVIFLLSAINFGLSISVLQGLMFYVWTCMSYSSNLGRQFYISLVVHVARTNTDLFVSQFTCEGPRLRFWLNSLAKLTIVSSVPNIHVHIKKISPTSFHVGSCS